MNIFLFVYNFLTSGLTLLALPLMWCHEKWNPERKTALVQRLGYDDESPNPAPAGPARPKIWIHAVSVGEVKAAEAIIHALDTCDRNISILLTTTTPSGQAYAAGKFGDRVMLRYAPLDLWWSVKRFLIAHRPDLLVCMETEIWPNWITLAHRKGIKTAFINGRISNRSIRSYLKIKPLIKPVLKKVDAFSMISAADARRIIALGAPARRVQVNGNAKMDVSDADTDRAAVENLRRIFGVEGRMPVFIAGSIRGAEAELLMQVYVDLAARIPDLVGIMAPRHIENSSRLASIADMNGVAWQYRSQLGPSGASRYAPLVILDTIGELRNVYSMASVVFCGASLVPLGGQNVLEPAAWAKPVLFGPFMEDFEEARILLETIGGGISVKDASELTERAAYLLTHPGSARRLGRLAQKAVLSNRGAAGHHTRVITDLLSTGAVQDSVGCASS
jgi:3-deoxy-D-manno-octulosonic-acid transferase